MSNYTEGRGPYITPTHACAAPNPAPASTWLPPSISCAVITYLQSHSLCHASTRSCQNKQPSPHYWTPPSPRAVQGVYTFDYNGVDKHKWSLNQTRKIQYVDQEYPSKQLTYNIPTTLIRSEYFSVWYSWNILSVWQRCADVPKTTVPWTAGSRCKPLNTNV